MAVTRSAPTARGRVPITAVWLYGDREFVGAGHLFGSRHPVSRSFVALCVASTLTFSLLDLIPVAAVASNCPAGYSLKKDVLLHSLEVTTETDTNRVFLNGVWSGTWCSNGRKAIKPTLTYSGQLVDAKNNTTWFSYLADKSFYSKPGGTIEATGIYSMKACFRYVQGQPCNEIDNAEIGTLVFGFHPRGYFVDEDGYKYGARLDQWAQ